MSRLTNLIKEVLSTQPKKKDCNCGCNTCDNVGNEGVLLNESVAPKQILSENLQYHVHNKLPLTENTFRYGSQSFINLWAEARSLYLREIIHVNDDDKEILTETDLGNYGMYEGKKVPLGLPMENLVNESEDLDWEDDWEDDDNIYTGPTSYGIDRRTWDKDWRLPKDNLFNASKTIKATNNRMDAIRKMLERFPKELAKFENDPDYPAFDMNYDELVKWYKSVSNFSLQEANNEQKIKLRVWTDRKSKKKTIDLDASQLKKAVSSGHDTDWSRSIDSIKYQLDSGDKKGTTKIDRYSGGVSDTVYWELNESQTQYKDLYEAAKKKKKKDPPIGKPKRGGSKAYYVYVRDPRTKKVKKISFGSGGLKAKINNPKARRAFAARHKCAQKKDRTKAGYWSCRLPRYAKLLGLKSSFSGFW